jgi:hypothetical protein
LLLPLEAGPQCFACHERHHVVQQAIRVAAVEERENVRVLQPRGGANLREEPFAPECGAQLGVEHLDRNVALVAHVVCEVHGRHAASAQFALDAIAFGQCGGEASKD